MLRLVQEHRGRVAAHDLAFRLDEPLRLCQGFLGLRLEKLGGVASRHPGLCRLAEADGRDEQEAPFRWQEPRRLLHREQARLGTVDAAHDAV